MKMKSLAVGLGTNALILLALVLGVARWAVLYRAPCNQPCQDLGHEPVPGLGPKDSRTCVPKCAPLKLDLELAEPSTRTGKLYTLWYKVTLTNVSCYDLSIISAEAFFDPIRHYTAPTLQVLGPDGKVLRPYWETGEKVRSEYGEVLPYSIEPGAFFRFQAVADLRMDNNGFVTMKPGAVLITAPSVVDPRKSGGGYSVWQGSIHSSGDSVEQVDLKGIPEPPAGYRILDDYIFKRPGRYTIRAIFDETKGSGIIAAPIYPYASRVPVAIKRLLWMLGLIGESDQNGAFRGSEHFRVRVESDAVSFEVKP